MKYVKNVAAQVIQVSLPITGMATEVRIPSPHRTGNVCHALSPYHALSHCSHAARLWPQCHRDTGWENQGVSMTTCSGAPRRTCTLSTSVLCPFSKTAERIAFNVNEIVKARNRCVHLTPNLTWQLSGEGFNTSPAFRFASWRSDITLRWELMLCLCVMFSIVVVIWCGMNEKKKETIYTY